MYYKWVFFALVIIVGFALFTSPFDQRQAMAKYLFFCLIAALVIKPIGLFIGKTLRRIIKRD